MTDADDLALLPNTPAQDKSLQHSLKKPLHKHKTKLYLKQEGVISTLSRRPLKLID